MKYSFHVMFLHWSATEYDWDGYDTDVNGSPYPCYNTVFQGDGKILWRLDYNTAPEATYMRNTGSISLAVACMGGTDPWNQYPPTPKQIEAMCAHAARLAVLQGWHPDPVWLRTRIMTHGEAASLRDFSKAQAAAFPDNGSNDGAMDQAAWAAGLPHSNYGPSSWWDGWPGGDGTRWDLAQLKASDEMGVGGDILRNKIAWYMQQLLAKKETK